MPRATLLYFAYGSNMSTARMLSRLPDACPLGMAELAGYELRFHKRGLDGSAKCNAFFRLDGPGSMYGAVYRISLRDKGRLDAIEGLGRGYRESQVYVALKEGRDHVAALTYLATHIDCRLKPYSWYLEHVLTGALEWGLPNAHITRIRAVETVTDPDADREARERAVHETGNGS